MRFPVLQLYPARPDDAARRFQVFVWLPDFPDITANVELHPDGSGRMKCHTRPWRIVSSVQETDRIEAAVLDLCRTLPVNAESGWYRLEQHSE